MVCGGASGERTGTADQDGTSVVGSWQSSCIALRRVCGEDAGLVDAPRPPHEHTPRAQVREPRLPGPGRGFASRELHGPCSARRDRESHGEGGQCEDSAWTGDEAKRAQLPCMARQSGIQMRGPSWCDARAMLRCCSRRAGSQAEARLHGHAGTSARTGWVRTASGITRRTYGGFASYDPAGKTFSILVLLQQQPALPVVNIHENTKSGG